MTVRSGQLPSWFWVPFAIGGLLVAIVGFVLLQDELRYGRDGVSVSGTVIEAVYHPGGGEDGPSYSIRYAFVEAATGSHLTGESDVSEEVFDAADPGEAIEVTYLPAEPSKSRVGSPEPQLFVPFAVMGGGALFAVIGVGLFVMLRRLRSGAAPAWLQVASFATAEGDASGAPEDGELATNRVLGMLGMADLVNEVRAAQIAAAAEAAHGVPAPAPPPASVPQAPTTDAELRAIDAQLAPPSERD